MAHDIEHAFDAGANVDFIKPQRFTALIEQYGYADFGGALPQRTITHFGVNDNRRPKGI